MKIGYARVSTDDQSLNLQLDALTAAGCDKVFSDRGVSGADTTRTGLSNALGSVQEGDVLIVWKLDRLGRSLVHLIELVETLRSRGAGFCSLTDGIDTTTSTGKLVFHIMGALAEFERDLIRERTCAGLAAARLRGAKIGRPRKLSREQVEEIKHLHAKGISFSKLAPRYKVNRSTLSRALIGLSEDDG